MRTTAIRLFDSWVTRALRVRSRVLDRIRSPTADGSRDESNEVAAWRAAVPSFDTLQLVLRLATQCPPGRIGDDIRRAACELIETNSPAGVIAARRRLLNAIAQVDIRRSRGRSRSDDPGVKTTSRLAEAVRSDLGHQDAPPPLPP